MTPTGRLLAAIRQLPDPLREQMERPPPSLGELCDDADVRGRITKVITAAASNDGHGVTLDAEHYRTH
jgi:hypothetical protein